MSRIFLLASALAVLLNPATAHAQNAEAPEVQALCGLGESYTVEGGPVHGTIRPAFDGYAIYLFVHPEATHAAIGTFRENDRSIGALLIDVRAPSLDLGDPEVRVNVLSIQGRPILAEDLSNYFWRVRLRIGDDADWYGPGAAGEAVFTTTGYTISEPFAAEPYISFRGEIAPGRDVYRRLIGEGRMTAEFHTPRRGFSGGQLVAVSEFSLEPLHAFMQAAQAHFAACAAEAAA